MDNQHKGLLEAALDAVTAVEAQRAEAEAAAQNNKESSGSPATASPANAKVSSKGKQGWDFSEHLFDDEDLDLSFTNSGFDNFLEDAVVTDVDKEKAVFSGDEEKVVDPETAGKTSIPFSEDKTPAMGCEEIPQLKSALKAITAAHAEVEEKLGVVTRERDMLYQENQQLMAAQKTLNERMNRLNTDFENYRKRIQRDQDANKKLAEERIVSIFLPVMDNFERAIIHAKQSQDYEKLLQGVEMTSKLYLAALAKLGCIPFNSMGETFDPVFHDVLQKVVQNDVPNNSIVQEHLKGYIMHERVLRPALVVVAQNETAEENAPAEQPEGEENV